MKERKERTPRSVAHKPPPNIPTSKVDPFELPSELPSEVKPRPPAGLRVMLSPAIATVVVQRATEDGITPIAYLEGLVERDQQFKGQAPVKMDAQAELEALPLGTALWARFLYGQEKLFTVGRLSAIGPMAIQLVPKGQPGGTRTIPYSKVQTFGVALPSEIQEVAIAEWQQAVTEGYRFDPMVILDHGE